MRTLTTVAECRTALLPHRLQEKIIGFVPTMGALHEGHFSLIRQSKLHCDVTVVSIFVNPTQFGPSEDFDKYPRTFDDDALALSDMDVEFLFAPDREEMYPRVGGISVNVGDVAARYEGAVRPGHFNGVATVVASLFNIIQPSIAFFGQKDAQQVAVIRRMVEDLHWPVEIQAMPTIREESGLALSSRNRYLDEGSRIDAAMLYRVLENVANVLENHGSVGQALEHGFELARREIPAHSLDYLDVVDSETFQSLTSLEPLGERINEGISAAIIIAARIGGTRLIDNRPVTIKAERS
jgi:pantoate--beta-alanine ligase